MDLNLLAREIKEGVWEDLMASYGASEVLKMSVSEIHGRLLESCGTQGGAVVSNCWFDIYWTASWVNALLGVGVAPGSTVLEIGAGLSSNFVRAASSLLGGRGQFVAVNLNKRLTESFKSRNRLLPIRMRFVEANALHVRDDISAGTCAFAAFNHEINDIVQTIVFENDGRTTDGGDWFAMVPEMVRLIQRAHETGEMVRTVRPQFLRIIEACTEVLAPGGVLGFNNSVTPLLLRHGYSEELLGSFIPLARGWIAAGIEGLEEKVLPGFDPKWWMFFAKTR